MEKLERQFHRAFDGEALEAGRLPLGVGLHALGSSGGFRTF